ncbi:extensin-like protein [Rhodovulum sp. PH10]|nr:extensin-like protein [Rhodovulum sp. PH10]
MYLVGSLVLVLLAGCAHNFMSGQREPWRREAEVQCLQSGAVTPGSAVALLSPIDGPGMCGAAYPLKVTALGESGTLGYTDEPIRPPGAVPGGSRAAGAGRVLGSPPGYLRVPDAPPPSSSRRWTSPDAGGAGAGQGPGYGSGHGPVALSPPGVDAPPPDAAGSYTPPMPSYGGSAHGRRSPAGASSKGIARSGLPPVSGGSPSGAGSSGPSRGPFDYSDPTFSPVPMHEAVPRRGASRATGDRVGSLPPSPGAPQVRASAVREAAVHADPDLTPESDGDEVPPSLPAMGERVPVSPSRATPLSTASLSVALKPAATLACPMVSALDRWVAEGVQPAAQKWFGQPVVQIKQISAYSCRGMNGNPRAKISEHAFGNALDIAGFVLADGHVITIKGSWRGTPEEQGFLHDVQGSACDMFTTVLAPGSNVFHYDHIHVDLMRRSSGRQICQPKAIPGDVVAARARGGSYARRHDGGVTGSIGSRRHVANRPAERRNSDEPELPAAVAGED